MIILAVLALVIIPLALATVAIDTVRQARAAGYPPVAPTWHPYGI